MYEIVYENISIVGKYYNIFTLHKCYSLSLLYADAGLFSDIQNTDADIHSGI